MCDIFSIPSSSHLRLDMFQSCMELGLWVIKKLNKLDPVCVTNKYVSPQVRFVRLIPLGISPGPNWYPRWDWWDPTWDECRLLGGIGGIRLTVLPGNATKRNKAGVQPS